MHVQRRFVGTDIHPVSQSAHNGDITRFSRQIGNDILTDVLTGFGGFAGTYNAYEFAFIRLTQLPP